LLRKKKVKEVEEVKEVKDCEAGIGWMSGEETKELTQRAQRREVCTLKTTGGGRGPKAPAPEGGRYKSWGPV